ncbi:MAG: RNA polymerase sigma factor [Bacteroidales bacterium]|nr:RNA polymerase sigma factor [Bacteroidales bacterium]
MTTIQINRFQKALYDSHHRRIYSICYRITGNQMDAEEVMHDAFLKIFAHLNDLQEEKAFITWSRNIAVRTAIDKVRRKKIIFEPIDELSIAEEEPDEMPEWTVEGVKKALNELPKGYRIIVSLRLFEEYSFEDIARTLHIKESTVRSQFARGREKLAQKLKVES